MYDHVQRQKYYRMVGQIVAVEHGIERAMTERQKRPDFPTYDEMMGLETAERSEPQKPAWMLKYEEVNRERMLGKGMDDEPQKE